MIKERFKLNGNRELHLVRVRGSVQVEGKV
jgi:hypothetical protein